MGQLVLTRRAGEKLRIGEDIVITILQTGNQVDAAIDAAILSATDSEVKK